MEVLPFPPRPTAEPLVATPHARAFVLAPGAPLPDGTDAVVTLPDASRFAYAPAAPGGDAAARELAFDPFTKGTRFAPLHDSPRAQAALIGIAAARRVDTGPESERMFLILRGAGLVFDQHGETMRFEPSTLAVAPPGEPARLWAQGPEDVLAIVFQPKGVSAPRRTLASEIAKRRASGP